MHIGAATTVDADAIWRILEPMIRAGETYALPRDMSRADALAYWMSPRHETFVAESGGAVVGTYYLRANQPGGGAHVANCGYVTAADATGKGVARAMCGHSLAHAKARGFRAVKFDGDPYSRQDARMQARYSDRLRAEDAMASKLKGTARLRRLNATLKRPQADLPAGPPGKISARVRTYSEGHPDEIDVVKLRKRLGYR